MRGDVNAVQPAYRQLAVLHAYLSHLTHISKLIQRNATNDSDAERIATIGAERDWATSKIQEVTIEQRQEEKARHDAEVAALHGFGTEPSFGPDTGLHVDDAAQSMYASHRGAASPRRHSIDLGAVSPIAGTAVGRASQSAVTRTGRPRGECHG